MKRHSKNILRYSRLIVLLTIICYSIVIGTSGINTTFIYPPWKHTWGVVRATPLKLFMLIGGRTRFNDPQGIACVRLKVWEDTMRTGDDDEITAYGVNSGDNCIIYNRSMFSLGIYGLDEDHYKFNKPWGIAADSKGNVYVADRGNDRVVRLFNSGEELYFIGTLGGPNSGSGLFDDPCGVALDNEGRVYVTDAGTGQVTVFNDDGQVTDVWEGLSFDEPDGIAVVSGNESWNYLRNDTFAVVIDSSHQRIRKMSLTGELITETRSSDWNAPDAYLAYVTLDYHNQLLVTDRNNGCIHKLDRNLNYITRFGEPGDDDYQFDQPRGICIYRRFGQLLVAERKGAQYFWVGVDVSGFEVEVINDSTESQLSVRFVLTEPAFVTIDILDDAGRPITCLTRKHHRFNVGDGHYSWWKMIVQRHIQDPSSDRLSLYPLGEPLPQGSYTVRAVFQATYSSREHFDRTFTAPFRVE